jgi:hypothetical protein
MSYRLQRAAALSVVIVAVSGCGGTRTMMPPRIDLQAFAKIGLVEFSANPHGNLQSLASQNFLQTVQAAQPGVPVLELGDEAAVLEAIGHDKVDAEAIRAIGRKFDVDAVIVGNLEFSDAKPRVGVNPSLSAVDLRADVEASLTTRLMAVASGATLWTRSARSKETVANVGLNAGNVYFGASDPEAAYGGLIQNLVDRVTEDFRPYWVKQ